MLISNLDTLWSKNRLCINKIPVNLLSLVSWPSIFSILENVLNTLEKTVYSAAVQQCVLQMSVKSSWFSVFYKFSVSLLIFCLVFLSIMESGELKPPTIIFEFSISPFISVIFLLHGVWGSVSRQIWFIDVCHIFLAISYQLVACFTKSNDSEFPIRFY